MAVIGGNPPDNDGNVAAIGGNIVANGGNSEGVGGNLAVIEEEPSTVDTNKDTDELTTKIVAEMRVNPYITVAQLTDKLSSSQRSIEQAIGGRFHLKTQIFLPGLGQFLLPGVFLMTVVVFLQLIVCRH